MGYLHNWCIGYNEYTKKFMAAKREEKELMYNDYNNEKVLKSNSAATLIEIINKTNGDKKKLSKLIR
jgi:hypothetical protein